MASGASKLNTGLTTLKESVDMSLTSNQENVSNLTAALNQLNASIQASLSGTSAS
ncbi:hypothetical protein, partial [uncultured Campylobacter sp.]|uniref:hypothetical protein n=1 Tax=uncultured Campylobacter sp. TaxID=218934 RepID=UPI0034557097